MGRDLLSLLFLKVQRTTKLKFQGTSLQKNPNIFWVYGDSALILYHSQFALRMRERKVYKKRNILSSIVAQETRSLIGCITMINKTRNKREPQNVTQF